jgi:hypothetical protein
MLHKGLGLAVVGWLCLCLPSAFAQGIADVPEGMDVQARGPIHEAFAAPAQQLPQAGPIVPKQPPQAIPEIPPDQKPDGNDVIWIPGYFSWDQDRNDFIWVSGIWRKIPPGRRWVPGYWTEVDGGFQWVPGFWAPDDQQNVLYQAAPPAPVDNGPPTPAPNPDDNYVPGNWVYRTSQYYWQPGFWQTPQAGWVWIPACYMWTPRGYVYVPGYWDYPLDGRGVMFAPVYFSQPLWNTAGWYYRPRLAICLDGLLSSLFVRPACGSYYFGDYYGNPYLTLGIRPWWSWGPRWHDPLFGYYRWHHRHDGGWYAGMRDLYRARLAGTAPLPPRTFVQQNTVINNVTNVKNVTNLRMVAPLGQVTGPRLVSITATQARQHVAAANQLRTIASDRGRIEHSTGKLALPPVTVHATTAPPVPRREALPAQHTPTPPVHTAPVHTPAPVHNPAPVHTAPVHTPTPPVHTAPVHTPAPVHNPAPVHTPAPVHRAAPAVHTPAPVHASAPVNRAPVHTAAPAVHRATPAPQHVAAPVHRGAPAAQSAPVHSAPVHSAPAHAAPAHSPPSHAAPAHSAPAHVAAKHR